MQQVSSCLCPVLQVQQLAVEQQLAGSDFAVTHSRPHKSKQARMDKMSSVWDWLRESADGQGSAEQTAAADSQQQQQLDQPTQQPPDQQQSLQSNELGSSLPGGASSQHTQQGDAQPQSSPQQQQQQQTPQDQVLQAAA
jgi:hypothetical protein